MNSTRGLRALVLAAIALCIGMSLVGAKPGSPGNGGIKIATINVDQVRAQSAYAVAGRKRLLAMQDAAQTELSTWAHNDLLTPAEQDQLSAIAVKPIPLAVADEAAEKTLTDKQSKLINDLQAIALKPGPLLSAADVDLMSRSKATQDRITARHAAMQKQLQAENDAYEAEVDKRLQEAVAKVAKKDGVTLVFRSTALPFADIDLTGAVSKEMK